MDIIVVSIHVTAAVILVLTVLLQAGKGSGMGAAFGGSSGTVFGARGPATLISKVTCAAAVIFMITSLNLALSQGGVSKKGSVMDEWSSTPAASAPAATPAAPAATPASEATEEAAPPAAEPAEEGTTPAAPITDDSAAAEPASELGEAAPEAASSEVEPGNEPD